VRRAERDAVGKQLRLTGNSVAGYNGIFSVTEISSGTTSTTRHGGLGAGTVAFGGRTAQWVGRFGRSHCLQNGKVIVTGGDTSMFLGQGVTQTFCSTEHGDVCSDGAYATWRAETAPGY